MKQTELLELMGAFDASGLSALEWEREGERIRLEKAAAAPLTAALTAAQTIMPAAQETCAAPEAADCLTVKSPLVGVFYAARSPEEAPFVREGDAVKKGQVLCLIEAMKMMSELTAPADGTVRRILVKNEEVVSFDQILFEVTPC